MNPQELKNSILQLAMQGKLVEQRPEEGTGEELYRKIQAEKQRCNKTGIVKRDKPVPEIAEDEKSFDIPDNWIWVRVTELGEVIGGGTPKTENSDYWDNAVIPWLTPADMKFIIGKYAERGERNISAVGLKNSSAQLMPKGTVLYSSRAPIGYIAIAANEISTNQGFKSLVPAIMEISEFMYYCLMARTSDIVSRASGTTFKEISGTEFGFTFVPLPPIAEQKRIVAKIEELMPYIDRYGQAWSKLEDFNKRFPTDMQKSILQMAIQGKLVEQRQKEGTGEELYKQIQAEKQKLIKVGTCKKEKPLPEISEDEKPFDIPEGWKWVRLGDLILSAKDGPHFSPKYQKSGIPFLSTRNISVTGIDFSSAKFISTDLHRELCLRCHPHKGDILYTKGGTTGIAIVNNSDFEFSVWVHVAVLSLGNIVNPYYLAMALNSPHCYTLSQKYTHGIGNRDLGLTRMINITVPYPPLAEQKRILANLEKILPLCERLHGG